MASSLTIDGVPYQYDAQAEAGVYLVSGERWTGTRVKYRPGVRGAWRSFLLVDVHPFDTLVIEYALKQVVERKIA